MSSFSIYQKNFPLVPQKPPEIPFTKGWKNHQKFPRFKPWPGQEMTRNAIEKGVIFCSGCPMKNGDVTICVPENGDDQSPLLVIPRITYHHLSSTHIKQQGQYLPATH